MRPVLEIAKFIQFIDGQCKIFQILVLLALKVIIDKLHRSTGQYLDPEKVLALKR